MATTVRDLGARIKALPARRMGYQRIGKLNRYLDIARDAEQRMQRAEAIRTGAQTAFPEFVQEPARRAAQRASDKSRALLSQLTEVDKLDEEVIDNLFTALKEEARKGEAELRKEWRRQIEETVDRFGLLARAASRTGLAGGKGLEEALNRIRNAVDEVPSDVAGFRRDLDAVVTAVGQLGLEGPVGEFLGAVTNGEGDPRSLADGPVQAFLEKHDLWALLKVVFR